MEPVDLRILGQLHTQPWLIEPAAHASIVAALEQFSAEQMAGLIERLSQQHEDRNKMAVFDGIAEVPVNGPLMRNPGALEKIFLGAGDLTAIGRNVLNAARNPSVRGVLLTIDSPGGSVTGTPELADIVRSTAKLKPVVAFTDGMAASAAYWIGSQASAIIASKSAQVGSIGVYIPWADMSKRAEMLGIKTGVVTNKEGTYKGMGYPGTSMTEAQMAHLKERADELFGMFKASVASTRKRVPAEAMQGQTFFGYPAQAAGLIDAVGGFDRAWNEVSSMSTVK